jgi:hypothetical protein
MPLDCLRNKPVIKPIGQRVPVQTRGIHSFYMGLKSKVGLVTAKASAFRINLKIEGCSVVAPPLHAPLTLPFFSPSSFDNIPLPRVH